MYIYTYFRVFISVFHIQFLQKLRPMCILFQHALFTVAIVSDRAVPMLSPPSIS